MQNTWTFWRNHQAACRKRDWFRWAGRWAVATGMLLAGVGFIAPTAASQPSEPTTNNPSALAAPLAKLLELVIRDQFREDFVDDDNWGGTRRVVTGYRITGKPFDWHVRHNKAEVNDGLWEKYAVRLIHPDEELHVRIADLAWRDGALAYSLHLTARLRGDARWERWRSGVKMLNSHAVAKTTVDVSLTGTVRFKLLADEGFPGMAVEPQVTTLQVKLRDFDLEKVSKLDGIAAHELGDSLLPKLQRELNRRQPKVVAKLNRSLEKQYDKLRFSPQAFVSSGWSKLQDSLGGDKK